MKKIICLMTVFIFVFTFTLTASADVNKDNFGGEICTEFKDAKAIVAEAYDYNAEEIQLFQYDIDCKALYDTWYYDSDYASFSERTGIYAVCCYGTSPDNIFLVQTNSTDEDFKIISLTDNEIINNNKKFIVEAIDKQADIATHARYKTSNLLLVIFILAIPFLFICIFFISCLVNNETKSKFSPDTKL